MNDYKATLICAEVMGLDPYRASIGGVIQQCSDSGIFVVSDRDERGYVEYDPLRNDLQAMTAMKKLGLSAEFTPPNEYGWWVQDKRGSEKYAFDLDLNRAIVYCVAAVHEARISNDSHP